MKTITNLFECHFPMIIVLAGCFLMIFGIINTSTAQQSERITISDAIGKQLLEIEIRGDDSYQNITASVKRKAKSGFVLVIPVGTYFKPSDSKALTGPNDGYYCVDTLSTSLVKRDHENLKIPVVKFRLGGAAPSKETILHVNPSPHDKAPQVLEFLLLDSSDHSAKQLAMFLLSEPHISRDRLDGSYIKANRGFIWSNEEALSAEDSIAVFQAFRKAGLVLDDYSLYTELVSLVRALGSENPSVRQFSLNELIALGALDSKYKNAKHVAEAIRTFLDHTNRSVRGAFPVFYD